MGRSSPNASRSRDAVDEIDRGGRSQPGGDRGEALDAGHNDRAARGFRKRGQSGQIGQARLAIDLCATAEHGEHLEDESESRRGRQRGKGGGHREGGPEIALAGERQREDCGGAGAEEGDFGPAAAAGHREPDDEQGEGERPPRMREARRRPGEQGLRRQRLDDDSGQDAVARGAVAVAILDRGRTDQDALAAQRLRGDAAAEDIGKGMARYRRRIDRIVDREAALDGGVALGEHRRHRRPRNAAGDDPEQHRAHLAVLVRLHGDGSEEGMVAQRPDRDVVDHFAAVRSSGPG